MRLITIQQLIWLPLGMIALSTTLLYCFMHGFKATVLSSKSSQKEMKHETQMKYNLMEEKYGRTWSLHKEMYHSTHKCNKEYANKHQLQQDHPCVINLIRSQYLREPAPIDLDYNLNNLDPIYDPSDGQSIAIMRILHNKTNGFFIECGGFDGEYLSNTLFFERSLNWNGILIEADRKAFKQLVNRNRKAYTLPVCLSTEPYPSEVWFNATVGAFSSIMEQEDERKVNVADDEVKKSATIFGITDDIYRVQCFPLYSILLAVDRTHIDYFGLDVEGSEYKILKTIPWHKVEMKTMTVEWNHVPEGEGAMTELMENNGFIKFGRISMGYSHEVVYIKDFLSDLRQFND